jgi:methylmalonyl-CoA mutase cobalamin-binding subunit
VSDQRLGGHSSFLFLTETSSVSKLDYPKVFPSDSDKISMSHAKNFTLIMLYDKMAASLPVAQALKEKNIDVHVVQNAGELIQSIASKTVDMVGLSVNHASSRSLIQVLREKTTVKILVFGEDKSPNTSERIDRADADFKVLGVATAYNIWMKIAQVVKTRMKENDNNGHILYGGKTKSESHQSIIIKSSHGSEKGQNKSEIISFSKKKKEKKFKNRIDENGTSFSGAAESGTEKEEVMFFKKDDGEKKQKKNKKGSAQLKKSSSAKGEGKTDEQIIDEEVSALESMFNKPFKQKTNVSKESSQSANVQEEQTSQKNLGVKIMEDATEMGSDVSFDKEESEKEIGSVDHRANEENSNGNIIKLDLKRKKKDAHRNEEKAEENEENVIPLKEIILSAANNSYISKEANSEGFGSINKMTVVPIDRNDERGFLIFCTSDNQFVPANGAAMESFKKVLNEKISDHGVVSIGESYNIETEEIEIQKWVVDSSDFHYMFEDPKSQKEVLICFLSKENIYPDTNKSAEVNMLKVELDVIPAQTAVNFNVFLYFSQNKRLIPYLRRGGKLTEEQVQRLSQNGIDTVYINESDRKALYSFFISQTLHQDLRPNKKAA